MKRADRLRGRATPGRASDELQRFRAAVVGALALSLCGCLIIPYEPEAETRHDLSTLPNPENFRLSVGPRTFLDEIAADLIRAEPRIERLDGQTFIDTASPDGELTLALLLDPATRPLIASLQADYLAVVRRGEYSTLSTQGLIELAVLLPLGITKEKVSATFWAAVIDLRELRQVEQLTATATGTNAGVALGYSLWIESKPGRGAWKGIVRAVAGSLAAAKPEGPIRAVFVALEPIPMDEIEAEAESRDPTMRRWSTQLYPMFKVAAPPPGGQGLIYFYFPAPAVPEPESLDIRTGAAEPLAYVTRLLYSGYYPLYSAAGEVTVGADAPESATDQSTNALTLRVESGRTYFVRGALDTTTQVSSSYSLTLVNPAQALKEIGNCRLMPSAREYDLETRRWAELGDEVAQRRLGELTRTGVTYADGAALPRDSVEADKWLQRSSDQ